MIKGKRIGLALSGGGFRAAAFHLGTFKKLFELGILKNIDVISTISGGSIIGAFYCLNKNDFKKFHDNMKEKLQICLITRILLSFRFITLALILIIITVLSLILFGLPYALLLLLVLILIILVFFHNIVKTTNLIRKSYDEIFYRKIMLKNLPDKPVLAINTTNLDSGRLMTFSKRSMIDSWYSHPDDGGEKIEFLPDNFPVSLAVAASTAVPYIFNPVKIKKRYFKNKNDKSRVRPLLVDGGVYDNQGIHKITQKKSGYKCDIIICSDGSSPFRKKFFNINPLPILKRIAIDVQMRRIKNLQFIDNVYERANGKIDEIAYFSLDWHYGKCIDGFIDALKDGILSEEIISAHKIPEGIYKKSDKKIKRKKIRIFMSQAIGYEKIVENGLSRDQIEKISKVSTSLKALKNEEIDLLIRHAETLTELHLRLYCPSLIA